jgi:hypothetical protein
MITRLKTIKRKRKAENEIRKRRLWAVIMRAVFMVEN